KQSSLVQKWERLRLEAIANIHRREAQIAAIEKAMRRPVIMYDSVNPSRIPRNAEAVAGYVNGKFANYGEMLRLLPKAKHVSITINAVGIAQCLDVETGDATPDEAPKWVIRERSRLAKAHKKPIVYANASTWPEVQRALDNWSIDRNTYHRWVADYDH